MNKFKLQPVPFHQVKIDDRFWSPRFEAHRQKTIPVCLEKCEETGRISNFAKAAGLLPGEFEGTFFNDSDVYKVLEGIAYSLALQPDPALELVADGIIAKIAAAQQPDGYLMTYYTLNPDKQRWTDMSMHETYCAGHLIEAAVAYKNATGKLALLQVAVRLADYLDDKFGPEKDHWVPGHQEIELALFKLYHETGEERYLRLAMFFLEERGHGYGKGEYWDADWAGAAYCQDDIPMRDISRVTGHAVRAMYYYTGMADAAADCGDEGLANALDRVWDHVCGKNMYITGAIGPSSRNEGFTEDYDLQNAKSYCETCASVGMVYWNHRMNLQKGNARYVDVLERAMYNGALSGVSLDGSLFYYSNPLSSDGTRNRKEWFDCSCCPTQIARFLPSIGGYVFCTSEDGLYVNLYLSCQASMTAGSAAISADMKTDYPWEGRVTLTLSEVSGKLPKIALRKPEWCRSCSVTINGNPAAAELINGYLVLNGGFASGDVIILDLDMPVETMFAHPLVKENIGSVALQRGPLVYCAEAFDNPCFDGLSIGGDSAFLAAYSPALLGGVVQLTDLSTGAILIPYYCINNRGPSPMNVWLKWRGEGEPLYSVRKSSEQKD